MAPFSTRREGIDDDDFWNTQQKRREISARQFSTHINKLASEVWSCWPCLILAKNLGDVLARSLSIVIDC